MNKQAGSYITIVAESEKVCKQLFLIKWDFANGQSKAKDKGHIWKVRKV